MRKPCSPARRRVPAAAGSRTRNLRWLRACRRAPARPFRKGAPHCRRSARTKGAHRSTWRPRIKAADSAGKARSYPTPGAACLAGISRTKPLAMASVTQHEQDKRQGSVYRVAGAITIARAASTQREIDALSDPLTIDLSDIDRMDTVGAWIIYRTVRDRGAKVVGASRDEASLLKQVGEFDVPTRVIPDEPHNFSAVLG